MLKVKGRNVSEKRKCRKTHFAQKNSNDFFLQRVWFQNHDRKAKNLF